MSDQTTVDASTSVPDDDRITPEILKVAGVVVLGAIMSILDITVVNVALPTFQKAFDVTELSTVAWSVTGYTLALAAVIPLTGWAADRFGTKRLYMTAIALFTIGSVLCASAWSIESLVAFRVLQGLGGGMLMPLGMTIMTRAAGPHRMGRLMAILGIPMLLGPIMGPILGGWLIEIASWHWIFLINLPLGIAAFVYALVILPKDHAEPSESFDVVGMLLMSPGLALFLFGVSSIPETGTVESTRVLLPSIVGALLIVGFVFWAFKPQHPLLDLRLFKDRNLAVATITMFLFVGAFFGALLLVPTYFQQVRGESVLKAGLLVAPQGIGAMLTMPIAGTLVDRMPVGRIVRRRHRPGVQHRPEHAGLAHHGLAVHHGPRHGRHDDADLHVGAEDAQGPRRGPRLDADQRRAAGGQLHRRRDHDGAAHQRHQELGRRQRRPGDRDGPGRRSAAAGRRRRDRAAPR